MVGHDAIPDSAYISIVLEEYKALDDNLQVWVLDENRPPAYDSRSHVYDSAGLVKLRVVSCGHGQ